MNVWLLLITRKLLTLVETNAILNTLTKQNVRPQKLMGNLYSATSFTIQLRTKGCPFTIERGVQQGDSASPKSFIASLQSIFYQLKWQERVFGFRIENKIRVTQMSMEQKMLGITWKDEVSNKTPKGS